MVQVGSAINHPSLGLMWLKQTQWIQGYPELAALEGCPQDPRWHPEGDVWTHTLLVTDEAARIAGRDNLSMEDRGTLVLAALCHDLGKPTTTKVTADGVSSGGHPKTKDIYLQFLERIGTPPKIVERVVALCLYHLTHIDFVGSHRHVRRLALRLSSSGKPLKCCVALLKPINSGRPPLPKGLPDRMKHIELMAKELNCRKCRPSTCSPWPPFTGHGVSPRTSNGKNSQISI